MTDTYKRYDTAAKYLAHNVRLAKDPEVKETATGQMVRLTFVDTSRNERNSDMWIEVTPRDMQADLASYLKKGDTISVEGKLTLRKYGANEEKFALGLERAELFPTIDLFMALKERGFTPGAKGESKAPKMTQRLAPKKPNLDDDDMPF